MLNPWTKLHKEGPYILEEDKDAVFRYNEKAKGNYKIMDEVMPVPFVGDIFNSEIVILMSNPKYKEDTKEKENDAYKEKLIKIFNHQPVSYPFFGLDPQIEIGKKYWESKLGGLKPYYQSWEKISKTVAVLQLHPYSSKEFKPLKDIPSQKYNAYLVEKAIERNASIIIARGMKYWLQLVPSLENYDYFKLNSWRSPYLSERNCPRLFEKLKASE